MIILWQYSIEMRLKILLTMSTSKSRWWFRPSYFLVKRLLPSSAEVAILSPSHRRALFTPGAKVRMANLVTDAQKPLGCAATKNIPRKYLKALKLRRVQTQTPSLKWVSAILLMWLWCFTAKPIPGEGQITPGSNLMTLSNFRVQRWFLVESNLGLFRWVTTTVF